MPFVLFLFFGFILLLICGLDEVRTSKKASDYSDDHPPHKWQEEYLLACKYYQEFAFDPKRKNPRQDALIAARTDIYKSGYRPTIMGLAPMSGFPNFTDRLAEHRMVSAGISLLPYHSPSLKVLLKCREEDERVTGIMWHLNYKEKDGWEHYCDRMDDLFFQLVESSSDLIALKKSNMLLCSLQLILIQKQKELGTVEYSEHQIKSVCDSYEYWKSRTFFLPPGDLNGINQSKYQSGVL